VCMAGTAVILACGLKGLSPTRGCQGGGTVVVDGCRESRSLPRVVQRQDAGGIQPADGWPWGLGEHGGSPSGAGPAITVLHGPVPVEREGSRSGESPTGDTVEWRGKARCRCPRHCPEG